MPARIGLLTVELYIGGCRSLKEKRQVVQSLTARLRNDFNLSVAEVDHHDLHQRACLAIACVGNRTDFVNQVLDTVLERLQSEGRIVLLETTLEVL
ncbi:MAG: DUF503 domain-containing protein [Fimbriimonadales bacterium]|jgi:uncharacterized protein YlxP (DUF503 family)|nr:DUF503 domain-containing protein [Armatimonadota bacterium]MCX7688376.1 DUF503 domain-containing protein [Fimbriimonadales bacterium]CUU10423.1 hypothetical protein GBSOP10_106910 [Armatimonadetes bacterium GBS]CUU34614.1 hypothetical protein DCOP10_10947 [Armatimonadetes bacterium DC]CUU37914.1 hypothetical protein GXSOP10_13541 [Armatimonadetes bacterium GXS]